MKHSKKFGSFPPDRFIPANVRPIVDKFVELRANADDARISPRSAQQRIRHAEQQDIADAAEAIAAGKDGKPSSKHRDAAVKQIHDAEQQRQAATVVLAQVNAEVQQAFAAAADEVFSIADAEYERASSAYIAAIEALVTARREWADAVAARQYAEAVTHGDNEANYVTPRIDENDYKPFRGEVSLPASLLFAPRIRTYGSIHYANVVQQLIMGAKIPSYQIGNTLTVLESDYVRAVKRITSLSDWYEDGDGISRDTTPVDHVTIVKVSALTDGMRKQCAWL